MSKKDKLAIMLLALLLSSLSCQKHQAKQHEPTTSSFQLQTQLGQRLREGRKDALPRTRLTDSTERAGDPYWAQRSLENTRVLAIGDSLMVGMIRAGLLDPLPQQTKSAEVGRDMAWVLDQLARLYQGEDLLFISAGTNGHLDEEQVRVLMSSIKKEAHVFWLSMYTQKQDKHEENRILSKVAAEDHRLHIVPWDQYAKEEGMLSDGIHPKNYKKLCNLFWETLAEWQKTCLVRLQ